MTARVLIGVAIAGAIAFAASLLPSGVSVPSMEPAPATSADTTAPVVTLPPFETYAAIAERPLFNPARAKDVVPPPPAPVVEAPPPEPTLPPLDSYRLMGLVTTGDTELALVQRRATQEVLSLKPGDTLDGWEIEKVGPGGVTFSGDGRTEVLVMPKADGSIPAATAQSGTESGAIVQ